MLGNGENTSFWADRWTEEVPLRDLFPRLFSISMEKEASVASLKNIKGEVSWNLVWRRRLFEWEKILLQEMLALLNSISLSGVDDRWGWRPKKGEDYSVKSTYDLVSDLFITRENIPLDRQSTFKAIWKCQAPSKVSGFVWLVLHDRVLTRVNLCRR
jgi:hypothetical protein